MRGVTILIGIILLVIIGGALTSRMVSGEGESIIPALIRVTDNPDASVMDMTAWKAEQLFLVIGFVLFNLIGAGVTIMIVMWFLSWQVRTVQAAKSRDKSLAAAPAEGAVEQA